MYLNRVDLAIELQTNQIVELILGAHVSHLDSTAEEELNRLLRIVVDVENLFMCVHKEEDAETKQVYFYLFKVGNSYLKQKKK